MAKPPCWDGFLDSDPLTPEPCHLLKNVLATVVDVLIVDTHTRTAVLHATQSRRPTRQHRQLGRQVHTVSFVQPGRAVQSPVADLLGQYTQS